MSEQDFSQVIGLKFSPTPENQPRELTFFLKKSGRNKGTQRSTQCAIIYGKNGAGKSTIARALANPSNDSEFIILTEDHNHSKEPFDPSVTNINVYGEDFVRNNIEVEQRELKSIVLLGDQVGTQKAVDTIKADIEEQNTIFHDAEQDLKENSTQLEKLEETLKKSMKQEHCWEQRALDIDQANDGKRKSRKNIDRKLLESLAHAHTSKDPNELTKAKDSFYEKLALLQRFHKYGSIDWRPTYVRNPFNVPKIQSVLAQSEQTSSDGLGEVETRVRESALSIVYLQERITYIPKADYCPFCARDWAPEEKEALIEALELELRRLKSSDISSEALSLINPLQEIPDLPIGLNIPEKLLDSYREAKKLVVDWVNRITDLLRQKSEKPAQKFEFPSQDPEALFIRLNEKIQSVEKLVKEHNSALKKQKELTRDLKELNDEIARQELTQTFSKFRDALEREDELKSQKETAKKTVFQLKKKQTSEQAKLRNETNAVSEINELLAVTFGTRSVELSPAENGYRVISNGTEIQASKLSTGERNILALCYFLVKSAELNKYSLSHKTNRLIVLDDPISSFDRDNRYGVTAMINHFLRQNLGPESKTKILLLTHDLNTAFEMSKVMSTHSNGDSVNFIYSEGELKQENFEMFDNYGAILSQLYSFAFGSTPSSEAPSPNELRLVYEAFCLFEIGSKISDAAEVSQVRDHFANLEPAMKSFIDLYLPRIFMNAGSHSAMRIREGDFILTASLNDEEWKQFVKDTLVFIHSLSPLHICSRISGKSLKREEILEVLDNAQKDLADQI